MSAVCVAVVGKENQPLYLRTAQPDTDLSFHYHVHTSLDVIEEKVATTSGSKSTELREMYLGSLYPTEDYRIYGYITNTKVKFIIIIENTNNLTKESEIKTLFRTLHNAYCNVLCNPFYSPGEKIASRSFDKMVSSILQS